MTARWHVPAELGEAVELLGETDDAVLLAGGVSLVLFMNVGFLGPVDLVSLREVGDLFGVHRGEAELDIGAMETHAGLARDQTLRSLFPAASTMFAGIGNNRVRNWGTLGGNLAHADPAQDPPVMLAALGAEADVVGPAGRRVVAVEHLADGPLSPTIEDDEIITRIRVPIPSEPARTGYVKFLPGTQDDYATVSVAAALRFGTGGQVVQASLAAGSVGPTALGLSRAAEVLVGQSLEPDVLDAMEIEVRDTVQPRSDRRGSADYKRAMAGVMARRAVEACLRGEEEEPTSEAAT